MNEVVVPALRLDDVEIVLAPAGVNVGIAGVLFLLPFVMGFQRLSLIHICPIIDYHKDVIALNPGSLSYPRQEGKRPSYIIMDLDKKGEATFEIEYL